MQVSKERVRVGEFMKDYDKLKSGRVSCINFAHGLDLCGFGLTPDEVMVLENRYCCVAVCMTRGSIQRGKGEYPYPLPSKILYRMSGDPLPIKNRTFSKHCNNTHDYIICFDVVQCGEPTTKIVFLQVRVLQHELYWPRAEQTNSPWF